MKKFIALFWVLFALVITANAAIVNGECGDNLTWSLNSKDSTLTIEGTGAMTSAPWGEYKQYIKFVYLPVGLTSINVQAFVSCPNLAQINIPETVEEIAEYAFSGCFAFKTLVLNSQYIAGKNYTSDKNLYHIFGDNIKDIVFGDSVTSIGSWALGYYIRPTSVTIGENVSKIGECAFMSINGLPHKLYIKDLSKWCNIEFSNGSANPISRADSVFVNGELLEDLVIPEGVTKVNKYAFDKNKVIKSISIPRSLERIEQNAFSYSSRLKSVSIPGNVTYLGVNAFQYCDSMTSLTLSDGIVSISQGCFLGCTRLESVQMPNSVLNADMGAFSGCSNIATMTLSNRLKYISKNFCNGCMSLQSIDIPDSVSHINDYAFSGGAFTEITIPENVVSLSGTAFASCPNLKTVRLNSNGALKAKRSDGAPIFGQQVTTCIIGEGVTEIGQYFFSDWSSLDYVYIPNSVITIGMCAFQKCTSLASLTLPENVDTIPSWCFYYCKSLKEIRMSDNVKVLSDYAFHACDSFVEFSVPSHVDSIGVCTFANCTNLKSIELPTGVKSIGVRSFANCVNLESISLPSGVKTIPDYAFAVCGKLTFASFDSITTIGKGAFDNTPLSCLVLKSSTPPSGGTLSGLQQTSCDLYIPAGSVDTYSNTIWWEDFRSIKAYGKSYAVTFVDWNGQELKIDSVCPGESAIPPQNPIRVDYVFTGWDPDFSVVKSDLTICATYEAVEKSEADEDGSTITFVWPSISSAVSYNLSIKANGVEIFSQVIDINGHPVNSPKRYMPALQQLSYEFDTSTLTEGVEYTYEITAIDSSGQVVYITIGQFSAKTPSGIEEVETSSKVQKIISTGNIFIINGDKTYTLTGQEVQ